MNRPALAALNRPTSWALLDQLVVSASNFLTTLVVARLLSVEGFAYYSLAFLVAQFLSTLQRSLFTQPLNVLGAVESPHALHARYLGILRLHGPTALVVVGTLALIGMFFFPDWRTVFGVIAYVLTFFLQELVRRLHYTRNNIRAACANDVLAYGSQLLMLALIWTLQLHHAAWIFGGFAVSFGLAFVWGHIQIVRSTPGSTTPDAPHPCGIKLLHEHWNFSKWIVLSQFVFWGSSQIYPFQLAKFVGGDAVANYSAANSLLNALNVVRLTLSNYLPSRASAVFANSGVDSMLRYLWQVLLFVGGMTVLLVIGLLLVSDPLIDTLFAGKYQGAKELLPYLAFVHVAMIAAVIAHTCAMVLKVTNWVFYANAVGTAFSIVAGPMLVMRLGIWGAVVGLSIGIMLPVLIQGIHLSWHYRVLRHSPIS